MVLVTVLSLIPIKAAKRTNYELGWSRVSDNHSWKAAIYHIDITDNITAIWDR